MPEQKEKLVIKHELSMEEINTRIEQEFCYNTLEELDDTKLLPLYKECESVKNKIKIQRDMLEKNDRETFEILKTFEIIPHNCTYESFEALVKEKREKTIEENLPMLIPPGTKGAVRGNMLNSIIKQKITNFKLDTDRFEICFEKNCEGHFTTEKPDWYILEKSSNKIIIGMNQVDLWGGGQQYNRGSKYIENNKHNTMNSKLLCVVCNYIQFKSEKNKAYKTLKIGFENNTLCYLNNLENIITSYFN